MTTILNLPHLQFKHHLPFPIQHVVQLDGKGNYTLFSLSDGTRFTSSRCLSFYETAFPESFVRLHKNCIINLDYLKALNHTTRSAVLTNDSVVAISRRRWPEIRELPADYQALTPVSEAVQLPDGPFA